MNSAYTHLIYKAFRKMAAMAAMVAVMLMTLAGCSGGDGDSGKTLAVSVEPQRAILQEIVGDRYQVVTLLANGANPESFDPTMQTRKDAERAAAFFTTGGMPFEETLAKALPEDVRIVDTGKGIEGVYGTHGHHHHHEGDHHDHDGDNGERDPHIWASVRNGRIIARNMLDAMVELDPDGADVYRANYRRLDQRLDSLDKALALKLQGGDRAFAVWHPSLSYFARDYGLEQLPVGFENKEVSPRQLAQVAQQAADHGVRVFFFQKEYDSRQAQVLNDQMGTRLVTIKPLDADWEGQLTQVADELARK